MPVPFHAVPPPGVSHQITSYRSKVQTSDMVLIAEDHFQNLKALKKKFEEGKDFKIHVRDNNSRVTVVSPHGGNIETGTSELARALAGKRYNLFDFFGVSKKARRKGHVTSTNFRDKRLFDLLNKSLICVSLHRMRDKHHTLYLGGNNIKLKELASAELKKRGFKTTINPPRLKGKSKDNFVNHAREAGLQIEIPVPVANRLIPDIDKIREESETYSLTSNYSSSFKAFVIALRTAIGDYLKLKEQSE